MRVVHGCIGSSRACSLHVQSELSGNVAVLDVDASLELGCLQA